MTVINFKPTDAATVVEQQPPRSPQTIGEHLLLGRVLAGKKHEKNKYVCIFPTSLRVSQRDSSKGGYLYSHGRFNALRPTTAITANSF